MLRKPAVAGQFYAGTAGSLRRQIEESFLSERGPKKLPTVMPGPWDIKGCIVPHAGYPYSGPVAAHVYAALAQDGFPDGLVIVGPNHTSYGAPVALMKNGSWETPLGTVAVDERRAELLAGVATHDPMAHQYEHSIEVQLPFLQYLKQDFMFVPVCLARQSYDAAIKLGSAMAHLPHSVPIASSDFSHVGMGYGTAPPLDKPVHRWAEEQDRRAIDAIKSMDAQHFLQTVEEHSISMCGYGCVAAVMVAAQKRGASEAHLLCYSTSYDVYPADSCVGYGALLFM
jgi:AmmeMemoRadiSam system protein B